MKIKGPICKNIFKKSKEENLAMEDSKLGIDGTATVSNHACNTLYKIKVYVPAQIFMGRVSVSDLAGTGSTASTT